MTKPKKKKRSKDYPYRKSRKKILEELGYFPVRKGSNIAKNIYGDWKFISTKNQIVGTEKRRKK